MKRISIIGEMNNHYGGSDFMRYNLRFMKILYFLILLIFLFSCLETEKYEIKKSKYKVGGFENFEVKHIHLQEYLIKFNDINSYNGRLKIEKDTVFIEFNKAFNKKNRVPFFIKNNLKNKIYTTSLLKENKKLVDVEIMVYKSKNGLDFTKIVFKNAYLINNGYIISFSFNKGFKTLFTMNPFMKETLVLDPINRYFKKVLKTNLLTL
jgi:hypothetical protein